MMIATDLSNGSALGSVSISEQSLPNIEEKKEGKSITSTTNGRGHHVLVHGGRWLFLNTWANVFWEEVQE